MDIKLFIVKNLSVMQAILLKNDTVSQIEGEQSKIRNDMVRIYGDSMLGTLDLEGFGITGLNFPNSALGAINKKYLQKVTMNNYDNISTKELMPISRLLNDALMHHSQDFTSAFDREFRTKYTWLLNLLLRYDKLYKKSELHPVVEAILFSRIKDIICLVIAIIEESPQNIFLELKTAVIRNKLLATSEDHTDLMKIRRFIIKFANDAGQTSFELLLQKNLMFVDLGFSYVSDSLLAQFVI